MSVKMLADMQIVGRRGGSPVYRPVTPVRKHVLLFHPATKLEIGSIHRASHNGGILPRCVRDIAIGLLAIFVLSSLPFFPGISYTESCEGLVLQIPTMRCLRPSRRVGVRSGRMPSTEQQSVVHIARDV